MKKILIATKNPHKQKKLKDIVKKFFIPEVKELGPIGERGSDFLKIAENKARAYSKKYNGIVVSTDGGARIPSLKSWNPAKTRRFGKTDLERIRKLLKMMEGKKNRTVEWYEAIAAAEKGKPVFSAEAKAMDGVIDKTFNPKFYKEGIWLCSITSFPQFGGKNFFELNTKERTATEDSWDKLKVKFQKFFSRNKKYTV